MFIYLLEFDSTLSELNINFLTTGCENITTSKVIEDQLFEQVIVQCLWILRMKVVNFENVVEFMIKIWENLPKDQAFCQMVNAQGSLTNGPLWLMKFGFR